MQRQELWIRVDLDLLPGPACEGVVDGKDWDWCRRPGVEPQSSRDFLLVPIAIFEGTAWGCIIYVEAWCKKSPRKDYYSGKFFMCAILLTELFHYAFVIVVNSEILNFGPVPRLHSGVSMICLVLTNKELYGLVL